MNTTFQLKSMAHMEINEALLLFVYEERCNPWIAMHKYYVQNSYYLPEIFLETLSFFTFVVVAALFSVA